jgi:hypothetical protein
MVNQAEAEGYEHPLPNQLAVEFHLDRRQDAGSTVDQGPHMVSDRLFHFYANMFLKGGYIVTDYWPNKYSSRCTEVLMIKLFCPVHAH